MAFTPVDTPLQYQYKPLNLMAFAEPLMKMQEKYDLTKAAIEESDVKATALQWAEDPNKAKALEEVYRAKRDELAQQLIETGNYSQAATKIKKLQQLWTQDPERVALESNLKLWEERNKQELDRVAKGLIDKTDYLQWANEEKRKFKEAQGTNYRIDETTGLGTYNPVTTSIGREQNLQKDLDDLKYKVAGDIKAKKWSSALQSLGIDPMSQDAKYVQSEFEKLSPDEIEQRVEEYIKGLDRFKPWLNESADYNFNEIKYAEDGGKAFGELTNELLTKNYESNEAYIKYLEKKKKTNTEDYKNAIANKAFLLEQKDNPDENVIKDLYRQSYLNKQYDAAALGQIFQVNNSSSSYTFRTIPKADTGGGDGTVKAEDLLTGSFTPNQYIKTTTDINKQKIDAGKKLYTQVGNVNNIGGYAFGNIVLGAPGSKQRAIVSKNPGYQWERQKKILTIATNSKNATEFYNNLKKGGFTSGVTQSLASTLYKSLSSKETRAKVANDLKASQGNYNSYVNAQQEIISLNKSVLKDKQFSTDVSVLGGQKFETSRGYVSQLAKAWGTTIDDLIDKGIVRYTRSSANKEYYRPESWELSADNIARANGYKNLKDAVEKGANIYAFNTALGEKIAESTNKTLKTLSSGNTMSFTYTGDPKLNASMNSLFSSAGVLGSFTPVKTQNWDNTPGFDAKGNLLPGTSFDFANGQAVKLVKHANQIYYELPMNVPVDGKPLKTTILVKPKAGTEAKQEQILRYLIAQAGKNLNNPTSAETYDMAQSALFDVKTRSQLTDLSADGYSVDKGDRPLVLQTVPTGTPGADLQIVKVFVNNDRPPVYKIRAINAAGTSQFMPEANGKEFASEDVDAAKRRIAELLY